MRMKIIGLATLAIVLLAAVAHTQQFTPPALPAGAKTGSESFDADILKIYALDDQGAKYRAYVVKYKGAEVVIPDTLALTDRKVGDKVKVIVARVELPFQGQMIKSMSFQILNIPAKK